VCLLYRVRKWKELLLDFGIPYASLLKAVCTLLVGTNLDSWEQVPTRLRYIHSILSSSFLSLSRGSPFRGIFSNKLK
jgi:hypothetical protein